MAVQTSGLGLGQLLLALDRTMVSLVEAPRGLDMPVGSVALVDADDVRLGLSVGPGSADLFFLLGVSDAEALRWIGRQAGTGRMSPRSEEHTSELQSHLNLVCRLLLEKKKKYTNNLSSVNKNKLKK